ncbi:SDR family NAD(P)-dependent oxidoreductase [Nocardia crassostreae]|uniref:SDR family NAD(P)-dependent oxidoreductase n=1 Tax=Nocardia crassostreae TaxID=53428 RepID=UPI00350E3DC2
MRAPGRIVVTASEAHRIAGRLNPDTIGAAFRYNPLTGQRQYGRTKLLNILFTQELARRLARTGITVNCFCPGLPDTGVAADSRTGRLITSAGARIRIVRPARHGARLGTRLVCDPELVNVSGEFFTATPGMRFLPRPRALRDTSLRTRAWERSCELVGVGTVAR